MCSPLRSDARSFVAGRELSWKRERESDALISSFFFIGARSAVYGCRICIVLIEFDRYGGDVSGVVICRGSGFVSESS